MSRQIKDFIGQLFTLGDILSIWSHVLNQKGKVKNDNLLYYQSSDYYIQIKKIQKNHL